MRLYKVNHTNVVLTLHFIQCQSNMVTSGLAGGNLSTEYDKVLKKGCTSRVLHPSHTIDRLTLIILFYHNLLNHSSLLFTSFSKFSILTLKLVLFNRRILICIWNINNSNSIKVNFINSLGQDGKFQLRRSSPRQQQQQQRKAPRISSRRSSKLYWMKGGDCPTYLYWSLELTVLTSPVKCCRVMIIHFV